MINIVIIEDEIPARKKLKRFIEEQDVAVQVIAELDTVETAIQFLEKNKVDLIFSDIELLDGNAFEIYQRIQLSCPVIFATAYDQFWMDAFESNGIAYLLKPFSKERFQKSWDKFILFRNSVPEENMLLVNLTNLVKNHLTGREYKKRFTVHSHRGIYFLDTETITYFEASEGLIFACDTEGKKHILNEPTLKEIEEQLDPRDFFRISRGELVGKQHVEKIERYTKNTLAIKIKGYNRFLTTSQNNTAAFREWITK